jgi:sulfide:quinone oxidoreductase
VHGLRLDAHGFIRIDRKCRVLGAPGVFAACDGTDFPVRQGSVAAQQAAVAARGVAELAGVPIDVHPFRATVYASLATGRRPVYLKATVIAGEGTNSEIFDICPWSPPTKVVAPYLGPYLEQVERRTPAAAAAIG